MSRENIDGSRGELRPNTEKPRLSARDTLLVVKLLENPPEPSARLLRAARAGFVLEFQAAKKT